MEEGQGDHGGEDAGGEGAGGAQGVLGGSAIRVVGIKAEAAAADRPRHHQASHQPQPQVEALVGIGGLDFLGHHHGAAQQAAAAGPQHRPPGPGGDGPAAEDRAPRHLAGD